MAWIFVLITAIMDVASSILIKEWTPNGKILGLHRLYGLFLGMDSKRELKRNLSPFILQIYTCHM